MPIPLEHRVAFNEAYNDDDSGGPWTLFGRDYVLDEIWRPLESYRAWPAAGTIPKLCEECRARVGELLGAAALAPVAHGECPGLQARPIVVVAANVPRRSGKTTNGLAYGLSAIFLEKNKRVAYIASAEDQADRLVDTKLKKKIEKHPSLVAKSKILGSKIEVPKKNSSLDVLPASHASVTGSGYTTIIVDEARDLGARVFAALVPSIFASHGVECPNAHGTWPVLKQGPPPPTVCPLCGSTLERWFARLLVMSASGVVNDIAEKDWFDEFIDKRQKKPHHAVHVWRTEQHINPSVATELVESVAEAFADVEGLADYFAVEVGNKPIRRGEVYLKKLEIDAVVDHALADADASTRPAIAFVDTSKTGDKTSLVICTDDSPEGSLPFARLALTHLKVWDPADRAECPGGFVDPLLVEAHLDRVVPRFTRLLKLKVDTRVMPWAKQLVAKCQAKPWGRGRVEPFEGNSMDDSAMYLELLERVTAKTIRLPNHAALLAELVSLRKQDLPKGGIKVLDANADKTGRNRRQGGLHRDIAMSLAACCLLAAELVLVMPEQLDSVSSLEKELDALIPKPVMRDIAQGKF